MEIVEKVRKVKRPTVDWYTRLFNLENPAIEFAFLIFRYEHPSMSKNRCAFNVLKKYYSTTSLNRVRYFGLDLGLEPLTKKV